MTPDEAARAAWAEITTMLGALNRLRTVRLEAVVIDALALAAPVVLAPAARGVAPLGTAAVTNRRQPSKYGRELGLNSGGTPGSRGRKS